MISRFKNFKILGTQRMNNQVEYVESEKRKRKVIFEGYVYQKQRSDATKSEWQCEKRGICKARMHVSPIGTVIPRFDTHTHAPSNPRVESLRVLEAVRMEATTSQHPYCPSSCKQLLKCSRTCSSSLAFKVQCKENSAAFAGESTGSSC